jgi:hypothetical protein
MLADLALMTVQTQFAPVVDVLVHVGPHKFAGDCPESGLFSKVSKTMDGIEHLLTPWCWNERSGASTCCVTQQFNATNVNCSQHHAGVNFSLVVDGVGIGQLTCSHVPEVDRGGKNCIELSARSAEGIGHYVGFSRQVA